MYMEFCISQTIFDGNISSVKFRDRKDDAQKCIIMACKNTTLKKLSNINHYGF